MLEDKIEAAEGSDERAGYAVHHHHGEEQHHPGVLLPKPELVGDGASDARSDGVKNSLLVRLNFMQFNDKKKSALFEKTFNLIRYR
jgi:hypothetical protein